MMSLKLWWSYLLKTFTSSLFLESLVGNRIHSVCTPAALFFFFFELLRILRTSPILKHTFLQRVLLSQSQYLFSLIKLLVYSEKNLHVSCNEFGVQVWPAVVSRFLSSRIYFRSRIMAFMYLNTVETTPQNIVCSTVLLHLRC